MDEQFNNQDEQLVELTEKEARRLEIERDFSYDGFQVVRKELFSHVKDPAVVIRYDSVTFNTACIGGLEDAVYIHMLINEDNNRIVVKKCGEYDVDALRWCVAKQDSRKSRTIMCREFSKLIYEKMGWDKRLRYKMMGYKIDHKGEELYVFDLEQPEMFVQKPKKNKGTEEELAMIEQFNTSLVADPTIPQDAKVLAGRKGFFPVRTDHVFGMSVEEHEKSHEVKELDGMITMAMLTGNMSQRGEGNNAANNSPQLENSENVLNAGETSHEY